MVIKLILVLVAAYLIGSISPGYLLGRAIKKKDIRKLGFKHTGTSNVYRLLGLKAAAVTGLTDFFKGTAAMLIATSFGFSQTIAYLAGFAAMIGHVWPFYLGFRAGRGALTLLGVAVFGLAYYKDLFALIFLALVLIRVAVFSRKFRAKLRLAAGLLYLRTK